MRNKICTSAKPQLFCRLRYQLYHTKIKNTIFSLSYPYIYIYRKNLRKPMHTLLDIVSNTEYFQEKSF